MPDLSFERDTFDDAGDIDPGPEPEPWPFSPSDNPKSLKFDPAETFLPGDGTTCGMDVLDETGGIRACFSQIGPDRVSTLCNEEQRRCVTPTTRCTQGWCYVPPAMFLSGHVEAPGEYAVLTPTAMRSIRHALWVQQTETTLGQFRTVMGYVPDFTTGCGDTCPVAGISIFEAMEFANRMSVAEGRQACYVLEECGDVLLYPGGAWPPRPAKSWLCARGDFPDPTCDGYRLPSWEEWELAGRAGSPYCFPLGPWIGGYDSVDPDVPIAMDFSIYMGTSDADYEPWPGTRYGEGSPTLEPIGPQPARSTLPNAFGLYEVHGNVEEYTFSIWDDAWNGNLPADWNLTGRPPFLPSNVGHFIDRVTPETRIARASGVYYEYAMGTCAYVFGPVYPHAALVSAQATGMRLVRTTPLRFDER